MAVIAINKILDEVQAKYLPGTKVLSVVITAEMQMFSIDQVSTHIWAQVPKSILKGKWVDPLEWGGAMEAGGSKVEGKQASDGKQGSKDGKKGKKKKEKKKKKKKKKKKEMLAKGSDGESIKVYHPLAGPPPQPIPWASALELIATPLSPLLDPQPRPSLDSKDHIIKGLNVQVASLELQVERIPNLELQVTPPAGVGLLPDAETSSGNGQFPSPIHLPHIGGQGSAIITPQPSPHLGVEMEDDSSGDISSHDAGHPLPIPPPLTDLVPPIKSFSSKVDMELEDVDME
ncbi:hypothetical protein PAXRUDRAFT_17376 [Paxillus rubicundulus Ve08.2h10]|uniref:Unplaced genomic scaffold scaffold_2082, whole genome shotgun sequence n=1 Tax=Paxillus rubicundulus Ve08.2h10 TaxID=930991 RepID=A0A0D0CQI2_9AGAM|nr:hypothetical protein PAXRUDRAFT_17376 [Paxillus rubicundulus Ve08.2h10]